MKVAYLMVVILAILIISTHIPNVLLARNSSNKERYYVGYLYKFSYSQTKGISGIIKIVRPSIPGPRIFMSQWIDIKISYYMNHWVQLGYVVYENDIRAFYREICSWNGRDLRYYTNAEKPQYGRYYKFIIALVKVFNRYYWFFSIIDDTGGNVVSEVVTASTTFHISLQALIEMNNNTVELPLSHFKELKYFDTNNEWHLWNYHYPIAYDPYYMHEVNDHEFLAWG